MMADKKWFVVHAYSGFEKSVQRTLTERIKRSELQDQFGQILVPVEEVVEMKSGQKAISERKFFRNSKSSATTSRRVKYSGISRRFSIHATSHRQKRHIRIR